MLKGFRSRSIFRSISPKSFDGSPNLARTSILFGHNGSGKSSLAELLYRASQGKAPDGFVIDGWDPITGDTVDERKTVSQLAVFCPMWIEDNVQFLLEGKSAAAIVTFGDTAVSAETTIAGLEEKLEAAKTDTTRAQESLIAKTAAVEKLALDTQTSIVDVIGLYDPVTYTRTKYRIPQVKSLLEECKSSPTLTTFKAALKALMEKTPEQISISAAPNFSTKTMTASVVSALSAPVTATLIPELAENTPAQSWVEDGLELHRIGDSCCFCTQTITEERWNALSRHFDDSRRHVVEEAKAVLETVQALQSDIQTWQTSFPDREKVVTELRNQYDTAIKTDTTILESADAQLSLLIAKLEEKIAAPHRTDILPGQGLETAFSEELSAVTRVIKRHEKAVENSDNTRRANIGIVFDHVIGSRTGNFYDLNRDVEAAQEILDGLNVITEDIQEQLKPLHAARFTSADVARNLTQDLERVYGKRHLSMAVSTDETGKEVYVCLRDGHPATHLSEGEKRVVALLYFLRSLEDGSSQCPQKRRIVVVDDPASSLDRNALFATHSKLNGLVDNVEQLVVLTHDFELLRLFLKSLNNKRISDAKDAKEKPEKKVKRAMFGEINAGYGVDGRISRFASIPHALLNHPSEYHFLFSRLHLAAFSGQADTEVLMLPNAARRLLEIFVNYHRPGQSNFLADLEGLVEEHDASRPAYDFCNRYSHGEDFGGAHLLSPGEIQMHVQDCLGLIEQVDQKHYDRMVTATGVLAN